MSVSKIDGEVFSLPRGGALFSVVLCVIGILVGMVFVVLWLTGAALIGLGLAGIGIAALCAYLLPEMVGPAFQGDSLILGATAFQYIRGGTKVLGNIPLANVDEIVLNERDGGNSLWIRLKDPTNSDSFWVGGVESMSTIYSQCSYHLVVGQGLRTDAKTLAAKFAERLEAAS